MQVPNGARPRDERSTEASGPELSLTPSETPAPRSPAADDSDVECFDEACEVEVSGPSPRELSPEPVPEAANPAPSVNGSAAPLATPPNGCAAPAPGDDLPACWERIQTEVQSRVKKEQFETWFRRAALRDAVDGTLAIAVQNTFARDWLNGNYREQIDQAVQAVLGADWSFELVVDPELTVMTSARVQTRSTEGEPARAEPCKPAAPASAFAPTTPAGSKQLLWASDVVLNPQYRFDNFVVGPCNRFAHAAALGVSEMPGSAYNPLFLHGSVGLGKTHLLQSMCFSLLERVPETRILYLSCETFINHFIGALENGDLHKFRGKYRNVDVLVVDDIHLLANKDRTQEEFFHTFNTLYNAGKQIVLSSDSPPKEIPTLQDRLVSRFKWGLVSEIERPCYETRMAIIKRKSKQRCGKELPEEVAQLLAENVSTNIRELEGAVTRVIGYSTLSSQPITPELVRKVLNDVFQAGARGQPTMDDVLKIVTAHFNVKVTDLQSRRRTNAIAHPRQVGMYLARKITRHSLEEIGGFFGGRDHSTVLYAVEKVERVQRGDEQFRALIGRLLDRLQQG